MKKVFLTLTMFIICILMIITFTSLGCSETSEQDKDNEATEEEMGKATEASEEEPEEVVEETVQKNASETELETWDEWLDGFKEVIKEMIEKDFGGELTKIVFGEYDKGPVIAYNTKWGTDDTIKKELYDITKIFAYGDMAYYDLDLTATNNYGDSIRAYTASKYMKKIENLELSYDEWVSLAVEGKEIVDESDISKEEESNVAGEEESEIEEETAIQETNEETILNQIMEQAKKDWPDDREMQEFQYNNQVDAYHDILDLPNTSDYHEGILTDAQKDWPGDYEMQLFQYENQLEAYHDILNLPNTSNYNEAALNRAKSDWPGDYEMQLWQYNNEK